MMPDLANALREGARLVFFLLLVLALTFSYAITNAFLPAIAASRPVVRMACWTLLTLTLYSAYACATTQESVPGSLHWDADPRRSLAMSAVVAILAGLAVLLPSPGHDRLDMLYIVAIAVVGEEVLFRGLLWDLIDGWSGRAGFLNLSGRIWLTALAFGLMHLQYHRFQLHRASIAQSTYSFAVGIGLGVLRQRTGSVLPAILAHSALNSLLNLILAVC